MIWLRNETKFQYISHRISSGSDSEVVLNVSNISEILWAKKKKGGGGLLSIVLNQVTFTPNSHDRLEPIVKSAWGNL